MQSIFKVQGSIQNYAWGGETFIPNLLNIQSEPNTPYAEYWLGVHKSGPGLIIKEGQSTTLAQHLEANNQPALPFLFKILDVKSTLSIQVHPNKQQAAEGFERENKLGISISAKNRNYKDNSDKPELMVALSPFWLLHGIAPKNDIVKRLKTKPYLHELLTTVEQEGISSAFKMCLDTTNPKVLSMHNALTADLVIKGAESQRDASLDNKSNIDYWVTNWINQNPTTLNGILSLYLMNLVALNKGDAIYQPPGLLHAYLQGQNVELMANSDNVLRAGLTPKHIDVHELLQIANFEPSNATDFILPSDNGKNERVFKTPFTEFELSLFEQLKEDTAWVTKTPELLFCYSGECTLTSEDTTLRLTRGESAVIITGVSVSLLAGGHSTYRVKGL